MTRLDAPATARNRVPILAILERWLGAPAKASTSEPLTVLEVASGTGQHAVFFAQALPHLRWQPSDPDPEHLASIEAWRAESGLENVASPLALDVRAADWGVEPVDAIFNANMIHIAPWSAAEGLFAGAGRVLQPSGLLFLYGPFRRGGRHTAPSNEAFDADLRRRNSEWGVRDQERVVELAAAAGLGLIERNDMPANTALLVFRKGEARSGLAGAGGDRPDENG
ncbi:DUF938 domain-containing protein [Myxococcota bacterium]|nr:DUF938 domain-containing protein [Myxococcota bacterium]